MDTKERMKLTKAELLKELEKAEKDLEERGVSFSEAIIELGEAVNDLRLAKEEIEHLKGQIDYQGQIISRHLTEIACARAVVKALREVIRDIVRK